MGPRATIATCGVIGAMLAYAATQTAVLRVYETYFADQLVSDHARPVPLRPDIVIVAIDDLSTEGIAFQSPISRRLLADVVRGLDRKGARVIALDVLLDRPSFLADDSELAAAMADANAHVIIGNDPGSEDRAAICAAQDRDPEVKDGANAAMASRGSRLLPDFRRRAEVADLVVCRDGDGVVRRMGTRIGPRPLLSEAIAGAIAAPAESEGPRSAGQRIPFALTKGRELPFGIYSAAHLDILPEQWIAGRAVLIGAALPYSGDWFETPLRFSGVAPPIESQSPDGTRGMLPANRLPGVVVHAYQTAALLDGRSGPRHSLLGSLAMALVGGILGAVLAGQSAGWRTRTALGVAVVVMCWLICVIFTSRVFASLGVLLPLTTLPLAVGFGGGILIAAQETRQRSQKQAIRRAFEHYLAPPVVEAMVRRPERLNLIATPREITVLFTDLAGFSTFVDTHPPEIVSQVINTYLETVISQVIAAGGVVDKIVGDAVHALFSAPIEDAAHRSHAILCALAIDRSAEAVRRRLKATVGVQIGETRIGVHSGVAMVGNFGGPGRFDYTAHGSTINGAARLEEANKIFGSRICISEATRVDVEGVVFREIARARLRGLQEPLRLYQPLASSDLRARTAELYSEALGSMAADPALAAQLFRELEKRSPNDGLVRYQLGRLAAGKRYEVVDA